MLMTITTSSHCPANCDNSAIPRASPPADNVPSPRFNPLLRVAPVQKGVPLKLSRKQNTCSFMLMRINVKNF